MVFEQNHGIIELGSYYRYIIPSIPHRHVFIEAQSTLKVVDPLVPPRMPVGETALLHSMTETEPSKYADLFLVETVRAYRDHARLQLAAMGLS